MTKIAWIGTGVMGQPMALHLAHAGYDVSAYNRTLAKAQALEPHVKAYDTIAQTVANADVIFSIVGFPSDVEAIMQEVFDHAKTGAILVDMTTSSPTLAIQLEKQAISRGFSLLDAPVTGGDLGAINATLSIMVGGDQSTFFEVLPLLNVMGKTINYLGEAGSGQHAKLANQIAIAGAIAGAAEALAYAQSKKLDLETMLRVLEGGSASSWQGINNGKKMIANDMQPGFYVKHFLKDLKLAMDEKHDLYLPILENVTKIYQILSDEGMGDNGTQAIINYYVNQLI